jgi:hypothetical protein
VTSRSLAAAPYTTVSRIMRVGRRDTATHVEFSLSLSGMSTSSNTTASPEDIRETAARHFATAQSVFDADVQSDQLMCRIYDKYAGPGDANHNCLGCNFDDLTDQVSKFLLVASKNTVDFDLHHQFSIYAFLLNTCWERITDVFDILGVPDGYRCRHFAPFIRVRRWANFFKHPKTFGWMVHHPHYSVENSDDHNQLSADVGRHRFIDDEFLKKYYSSDATKNAGKLRGEFIGFECSTVVVIPDVAQLTKEICHCLDQFVEIITENPIYVEMLNDTSTIKNFYEADAESDDVDCAE